MANRSHGSGLNPAIRIRVFEALKTLTDALDQSAANHFPAATDNLREAADGAMRAVARLTLELHADQHNQSGAVPFPSRKKSPTGEGSPNLEGTLKSRRKVRGSMQLLHLLPGTF